MAHVSHGGTSDSQDIAVRNLKLSLSKPGGYGTRAGFSQCGFSLDGDLVLLIRVVLAYGFINKSIRIINHA